MKTEIKYTRCPDHTRYIGQKIKARSAGGTGEAGKSYNKLYTSQNALFSPEQNVADIIEMDVPTEFNAMPLEIKTRLIGRSKKYGPS